MSNTNFTSIDDPGAPSDAVLIAMAAGRANVAEDQIHAWVNDGKISAYQGANDSLDGEPATYVSMAEVCAMAAPDGLQTERPIDLIPLKDAAKSVDRSPSTLRDWIRAGELTAYKGPGAHESNRPTLVSAEELRVLVVKSGKLANPPRQQDEEIRNRIAEAEESVSASLRMTIEASQKESDILKSALAASQLNNQELRDALNREISQNDDSVGEPPDDAIDYNQAATEFDRSRNTIRWWVRSGQLRSWMEGEGNHQKRLVSRSDVQALVVQAGKLAAPGGPGRGAIPDPAPSVPTVISEPDIALRLEVAVLRGEVAGLRGELAGARGELSAVRLALDAERELTKALQDLAQSRNFNPITKTAKASWWRRWFGGAA